MGGIWSVQSFVWKARRINKQKLGVDIYSGVEYNIFSLKSVLQYLLLGTGVTVVIVIT